MCGSINERNAGVQLRESSYLIKIFCLIAAYQRETEVLIGCASVSLCVCLSVLNVRTWRVTALK